MLIVKIAAIYEHMIEIIVDARSSSIVQAKARVIHFSFLIMHNASVELVGDLPRWLLHLKFNIIPLI